MSSKCVPNFRAIGLAIAAILVSCRVAADRPRDVCGDPAFTAIPAGAFVAGSDRAERDFAYRISAAAASDPSRQAQAEANLRSRRWFEGELPRQTVTLSAVCLSEHLVTNADYQDFVRATGHRAPGISEAEYNAQGFLVHPYAEVRSYLWEGGEFPSGRGDHPVVLVSYEDALAYARWRSARDGRAYRLPTALEWEKAARGRDGRYFPWGNTWMDDATNWGKTRPQGTSAVGAFAKSRGPYGGEDLSGNVFEYVGTPIRGGNRIALKGCSWDDLPGFCRAAYQHSRPVQSRHILFGFRLAFAPQNKN